MGQAAWLTAFPDQVSSTFYASIPYGDGFYWVCPFFLPNFLLVDRVWACLLTQSANFCCQCMSQCLPTNVLDNILPVTCVHCASTFSRACCWRLTLASVAGVFPSRLLMTAAASCALCVLAVSCLHDQPCWQAYADILCILPCPCTNLASTFCAEPCCCLQFTFVFATAAACIASQAMISAAFSIIKQSIALGCFPNLTILHVSRKVTHPFCTQARPTHLANMKHMWPLHQGRLVPAQSCRALQTPNFQLKARHSACFLQARRIPVNNSAKHFMPA